MENLPLQLLILTVGLVSGLIGAYVGLPNRALLADVRRELAELENRIIVRISGTQVRASECQLREDYLHGSLKNIEAVPRTEPRPQER